MADRLAARSTDIADRDALIEELLDCLLWYVENDDTNDTEHNEFYIAGMNRAKAVITKATGE
jgi:ribosomal 30S subunit maturation factor RimM